MRRLITVILLMLTCAAGAADRTVVVLPVTSQPAGDLVPALRPLVGDGGSVTAHRDRLVVKGTTSEIDAVRAVLAELDRPARRLLVEVRRRGTATRQDQAVGVVAGTGGTAAPGVRAGYGSATTRGRDDVLQRVQALDGRPALIRVGESEPLDTSLVTPFGYPVGATWRDTYTGFYALPRVHGDEVTVLIYQQRERPTGGGHVDRQQASSELRGRLGEWLTLGATGDDVAAAGTYASTRRARDATLELRVLALD